MIAAYSAVFIASLLGSGHCAGMRGAFLAVAVSPMPAKPGATSERRMSPSREKARLLGAYNGGRLLTYIALGTAAGAVGAMVDLGGRLVGLQRAATIAAGAFILTFGIIALLRQFNVPIARAPIPGVLRQAVIHGHRLAC